MLGLQLSALEIYSVVQRCCYFVVSSLVHSLSTHLQKKSAELLIAREDLMNVRAQQGPSISEVCVFLFLFTCICRC